MLIGLVGKPSVGKSTFFKAATLADVAIASYPFTTIKPNHAMAYVKVHDLAVDFGKHSNPREGFVKGDWRFVPFELADVAGLVEGASEGKGLGNQFLDDLSSADALIMVVDMSGETDAEGRQTENYYPGQDIEMIESELDKWYLGIFKKVWGVFVRTIEVQKTEFSKAVAKQFSGLKVTEDDVKHVISKYKVNIGNVAKWTESDLMSFVKNLRKETKPIVIAANKMDRPNSKENFEKVKKEFDYPIIPCSAEYELTLRQADKNKLINYVPGEREFEIVKDKIADNKNKEMINTQESDNNITKDDSSNNKTNGKLSDKQRQALGNIRTFLDNYGSTGIQEVLNTCVFKILKYIWVYPAGDKLADSKGNILPDCYLMPHNSTVLDFAFRLHTDIGKNFVKAVDVKTKKGVGKDHIIKAGDGYEILTR